MYSCVAPYKDLMEKRSLKIFVKISRPFEQKINLFSDENSHQILENFHQIMRDLFSRAILLKNVFDADQNVFRGYTCKVFNV
jgi:hypothetical protein